MPKIPRKCGDFGNARNLSRNTVMQSNAIQMEDTMAAVLEENMAQAETAVVPTPQATHQEIEVRAYFRYLERGCVDGRALDHWLAAEAELQAGHDGASGGS